MTPVLEVRELRKTFGGSSRRGSAEDAFVALDRESFTLPARGALAVVGESGSGKSTTARLIAGLERPDSGEIVLDGQLQGFGRRSAASRRARGRLVQMVFQDPYQSLDRRQRVRDCLAEVLQLHFGLSKAERDRRIAELLDQVGLDQRQSQVLPRALSGGQRQRVAIARALAAEPRILILDESVAALDVSIQAQVLNVLADIRAATEISYLFITHDLSVVEQVCDEIVVMAEGRIVEHGTVTEVLRQPQDRYTQRLLASVPRPGWTPQRHLRIPEPAQ